MKKIDYFKAIIGSLKTSIIILDKNYTIVDTNPAFCLKHETTREEIIGKHCYEITHRYDRPCYEKNTDCPARKVFETGKQIQVIHSHIAAEGDVLEEIVASPLKDEKGNVLYVIEEIQDVTELFKNIKTTLDMRAEIKTLKQILPICANCKKIRTDTGYWKNVEEYIEEHSTSMLSHGICPDCANKLYPIFSKKSVRKDSK
jgi:PAS domain S-box-containing protein